MSNEITIRADLCGLSCVDALNPHWVRQYADSVEDKGAHGAAMLLRHIAEQIEALKPSKPAEPTGLGAVVEASNGMHWVAARPDGEPVRWRSWPAGMWHPYEDIDAVRVLSEGVTP